MWGIRWNTVQKMLIDAPSYDYETKEESPKQQKSRSFRDYINELAKKQ